MARHKHKLTTCPNCDHQLDPHYDFCPMCGQENHDIKVPIGHIGYEFIEGITHFDTKVWQSLKSFFTKPGQMTKEYLDGKRARYVPAPRLYIFFSFIFFLILSNYSHKASNELKKENDRKLIQIKVEDRIFNIDKKYLELVLASNQKQIDSLLIATGNAMCHKHELFRKVALDSLKAIANREYNESPLTIPVDFTIGGDESESDSLELINERNEFIKDSIKLNNKLLAYDSIYNGIKTIDFVYNSINEILDTDFTAKELKLIRNYNSEELDSIIDVEEVVPNFVFEKNQLLFHRGHFRLLIY
jgi:hypothetical protein